MPRTSRAPSRSSECVPAASGQVMRPGTAATVRPSSAPRSAVVSDPERSVASTTTTTFASAAISRLRATNAQRWTPMPGGISDTTAPSLPDFGVQVPLGGRVRPVGAAGEHGDRRGRSGVRDRARSARPSRRRARGRRRRSRRPSTGCARDRARRSGRSRSPAAHRRPRPRRRGGRAPRSPATCSTAGGSCRSRSAAGYPSSHRHTAASAGRVEPLARRIGVEPQYRRRTASFSQASSSAESESARTREGASRRRHSTSSQPLSPATRSDRRRHSSQASSCRGWGRAPVRGGRGRGARGAHAGREVARRS